MRRSRVGIPELQLAVDPLGGSLEKKFVWQSCLEYQYKLFSHTNFFSNCHPNGSTASWSSGIPKAKKVFCWTFYLHRLIYIWARCCFVATCEHAGEHYENVFFTCYLPHIIYRVENCNRCTAADCGRQENFRSLKYGGFMALQVQSALKSAEGAWVD